MVSGHQYATHSVCMVLVRSDEQVVVFCCNPRSISSSTAMFVHSTPVSANPACGWEDMDDIHFDPDDFYDDSFGGLDDLEERVPADEYDDLVEDVYDEYDEDEDEEEDDDLDF